MKKTSLFLPALLFFLWAPGSIAQQARPQPSYQLPDQFTFEYEVVQQRVDIKKKDTGEIRYLYTKSGDIAGAKIPDGKKQTRCIIYTKDGTNIIIDDDKKIITIMRFRNMMSGFAEAAKGAKKTTPSSPKDNANAAQITKTGKSKMIDGYKAEEYLIADQKGNRGYFWYAKVDFNTQLTFSMGMGAVDPSKLAGTKAASNPMLRSLMDPYVLLAEVVGGSSAENGGGIFTKSISKRRTTISTKGYTVHNYSNMGIKEMMDAQMKKGQ